MAIFGSKVSGAEIAVDVTADTKSAEGTLTAFSGKMKGFASGFGTIMATGAALAGTAVVGGFVKMIKAGSDLNETLSKTGVVFGPATSAVVANAQTMADSFGLPKTAILDAASSFGLLFKGAGMAASGSADLANSLSNLAADASSFYNVPLEQALEDFRSGLVGESEPMRKYGVLLSEAQVQQEAYRMGIAKSGSQLTEQQKVMARSSLITKGLSDAHGDLIRTNTSVANSWRQLQGQIGNLAADLGMKLQPAISKILGWFIILVDSAGPLMTSFGEKLSGIWTGLKAGWDQLWPVLGPQLQQLWQQFQGLIDKLGGWQPVIMVVVGALALLIAPVPTIIAALVLLYAKFEGFRTVVNAVITFITGTVAPALISIGKVIIDNVVSAVKSLAEWFQTILPYIVNFVNNTRKEIETFANWIRPYWDQIWNGIKTALQGTWEVIKGVIQVAIAVVKGVIETGLKLINGDWKGAWESIKSMLSGIWEGLKSIVSGAVKQLQGFISAGMGVLKSLWSVAWNAVGTVLDTAWSKFKTAASTGVQNLLTTVKTLVTSIPSALSSLATKLYTMGMDMIIGMINGVKAMAGRLASAAIDTVRNAFNAAKSAIGMGSPSKLWETMGVATGTGLIRGMLGMRSAVAANAAKLASATAVSVPGPRLGGIQSVGQTGSYAAPQPVTTGAPAGLGGTSGASFVFHTYNPVAEPESVTTNRALAKVASLGLLG